MICFGVEYEVNHGRLKPTFRVLGQFEHNICALLLQRNKSVSYTHLCLYTCLICRMNIILYFCLLLCLLVVPWVRYYFLYCVLLEVQFCFKIWVSNFDILQFGAVLTFIKGLIGLLILCNFIRENLILMHKDYLFIFKSVFRIYDLVTIF